MVKERPQDLSKLYWIPAGLLTRSSALKAGVLTGDCHDALSVIEVINWLKKAVYCS